MLKILFVSGNRGGWPWELFKNLSKKLSQKFGFWCEHHFSLKKWILLHFQNHKNAIIVSSVPFLWRPKCQKFILNIHGDFRREQGFWSPGNILAHWYPKNIKFADTIIFPSKWLSDQFFNEKNIIIYNLIDETIFEKNISQNPENNEFFTITSFHFWEKWRGVLEIIKNLENLKKPYMFHIFGDGKFRKIIEKKLPKIHFGTIIWHRFSRKKIIFETISHNAIFIYASDLDVIPMSILETIQQNFPVCIKKIPQFQEFFENEIVFQNDVDFVKIIEKIQQNPENNKKISQKALKNFDEEKILEAWKNVF